MWLSFHELKISQASFSLKDPVMFSSTWGGDAFLPR